MKLRRSTQGGGSGTEIAQGGGSASVDANGAVTIEAPSDQAVHVRSGFVPGGQNGPDPHYFFKIVDDNWNGDDVVPSDFMAVGFDDNRESIDWQYANWNILDQSLGITILVDAVTAARFVISPSFFYLFTQGGARLNGGADGEVYLSSNNASTKSVHAKANGDVELKGNTNAALSGDDGGSIFLTTSMGNNGLGGDDDGGDGGNITLQSSAGGAPSGGGAAGADGNIIMLGLPTSNPNILGALYTTAGALMVSAG